MEMIKKIEDPTKRLTTFFIRRSDLLRKGAELSTLCDAQVAIIVFSDTGLFDEYSSSEMEQIVLRRNRHLGFFKDSKDAELNDVQVLKNKIAELEKKQLLLSSVPEAPEQSVVQQLQNARLKEQCVMLENEKLHRQIEELQSLHRSRENCTLQLFPCPVERKNSIVQDNALKPDVICGNSSVAEMKNRTPTLNLQLGLSSNARGKRKA